MDKRNSKNVKKTINRSKYAPKVQSICSKKNWASKNDKTQSKKIFTNKFAGWQCITVRESKILMG
jgi:hypothetical protein